MHTILHTVCRKSVTVLHQTYIKMIFKYKPGSYDPNIVSVNVLQMI